MSKRSQYRVSLLDLLQQDEVWQPQDRNRVWTVLRFGIFLPPGGAVMFWLWNMAA